MNIRYDASSKLLDAKDGMVKVAVKTVLLNIIKGFLEFSRINHTAHCSKLISPLAFFTLLLVKNHIALNIILEGGGPSCFVISLMRSIREMHDDIIRLLLNREISNHKLNQSVDQVLEDHTEQLSYLNDLLSIGTDEINYEIIKSFHERLVLYTYLHFISIGNRLSASPIETTSMKVSTLFLAQTFATIKNKRFLNQLVLDIFKVPDTHHHQLLPFSHFQDSTFDFCSPYLLSNKNHPQLLTPYLYLCAQVLKNNNMDRNILDKTIFKGTSEEDSQQESPEDKCKFPCSRFIENLLLRNPIERPWETFALEAYIFERLVIRKQGDFIPNSKSIKNRIQPLIDLIIKELKIMLTKDEVQISKIYKACLVNIEISMNEILRKMETKSSCTINVPVSFYSQTYDSQSDSKNPSLSKLSPSYEFIPDRIETAIYVLFFLLKWKNLIDNGPDSIIDKNKWWPFENLSFPSCGPTEGSFIDVHPKDLVKIVNFVPLKGVSKILNENPEFFSKNFQQDLYFEMLSENTKNIYVSQIFNVNSPDTSRNQISTYSKGNGVRPYYESNLFNSLFKPNFDILEIFGLSSVPKINGLKNSSKEKNPDINISNNKCTPNNFSEDSSPEHENMDSERIYLSLYLGEYVLFLKSTPYIFLDSGKTTNVDGLDSDSLHPVSDSTNKKIRLMVLKKFPLEDLVLYAHGLNSLIGGKEYPKSNHGFFSGISRLGKDSSNPSGEDQLLTLSLLSPSRLTKNSSSKSKNFTKLDTENSDPQYCIATLRDARLTSKVYQYLLNNKFIYRQKIILEILNTINSIL
ncbi:hypothetical protein AYI68_g3147 [Smittium mucronatum]|uniref:Uncharacterized protein n=1 Tax=Smittium mucronatum TaxID=133383 RepID=A0A1R0H0R6_9FUNG|nr:hypothetical protein AYI68_g3147 [Smittium mucronatum]